MLIGFVLGPGVTGALRFDARSSFVSELATVALVVILFRDGLEVECEMLQAHWRLPLRKLVLAMPLTAVLVALTARVVTGLSWTESFLLGALLSPTDPVLSSSVVTNPRVPRLIRHSLNLESGMNDGLALPAVLAFAAALSTNGGHFVWWRFVLEDVTIGLATGLVVGLIAARLMPRSHSLAEGIPRHQKSLYALGTALPPTGSPCSRRGATASSRCLWRRSRSASAAPTCAGTSPPRPKTWWRSSSSGSLSCSARFSPSTGSSATAGGRWRWWRSRCSWRGRWRCSPR